MRRVLLMVIAAFTIAPLSAQQRGKQQELINNTHEIRLGLYGVTPLINFEDMAIGYDPAGAYDESKFIEGDTRYHNSYALTYTHRTSKAMEFGVQASYAARITPFYSSFTGQKMYTDSEHFISLMPYARATWLNTPWVRLYSAVSIGFTVEIDNNHQEDLFGAFQLTPVGISVGRELFGFGELLTIGTNGFATIGIGYRF